MNIKYRLLCKRLIEERKRVGVIQYYNVLFIMELVSDKDIWALEQWMNGINNIYMKDIHNIRNSVAHQKKITPKQYYDTLKQLNNINCELNSAIEVAVSKEITESKKIDILGSFASLAGKLIMKNINLNIVGDMLKAFSERVNELVKPVEMNFKPEIVDSIRESALKFSSVDITSGYKEAMQNLACSFTAFDSLEGINEAIKSSAEEIGKYWSREEIDAIGTAAKLDDIAYQINQHNEN